MFLSRTLKQYEKPVLFGIVILIAITFGITSEFSLMVAPDATNPAFKMFGKTITNEEWQAFLYRWRVLYQFMLPPSVRIPEEHLAAQAKQAMMALHEARTQGIVVADGEVAKFVRAVLERGGQGFSHQNYISMMNQRRVRPDEFEETVREMLMVEKFYGLARKSATVSLKEVFDEYVKQNEESSARVVAFRAADLGRTVREISGAEVARHFQTTRDRYKIPDRVQIGYAFAGNEAMIAQVPEPAEEDLRKYYDEHKDRWVDYAPLFPEDSKKEGAGSGEPPKDDAKKDEPAKDDAKKEESGSSAPKDEDGDGEPDAKDGKSEEPAVKQKPFEQVKAEVLKAYKEEKAKDLAFEKVDELERALDEARLNMDNQDVDFEALARKIGVPYEVSAFLSRRSLPSLYEKIGFSQRFAEQVLSMEEGEFSGRLSTDKGGIVYRVLRKRAAEVPHLTDDIRKQVIKDLQTKKGRELAQTRAAEFKAAVEARVVEKHAAMPAEVTDPAERERMRRALSYAAFEEVAAKNGYKVDKTDWFKRDGWIPGLKTYSREFAESALVLDTGNIALVPSFQEVYVLVVEGKRPPDSAGFLAQRDLLQDKLLRDRRTRFMEGWQQVLETRAAIEDFTVRPRAAFPDEEDAGEVPVDEHAGHDHSGHDH